MPSNPWTRYPTAEPSLPGVHPTTALPVPQCPNARSPSRRCIACGGSYFCRGVTPRTPRRMLTLPPLLPACLRPAFRSARRYVSHLLFPRFEHTFPPWAVKQSQSCNRAFRTSSPLHPPPAVAFENCGSRICRRWAPAGVAELADARDLKSLDPDTGRAGSSPAPGSCLLRCSRSRKGGELAAE